MKLGVGCSPCWSCSDTDERNTAFRAVSDAANTLVVAEYSLLIHEFRDEAGRHQRHVGKQQLDVSNAGTIVHVEAVFAQLRVHYRDLHR